MNEQSLSTASSHHQEVRGNPLTRQNFARALVLGILVPMSMGSIYIPVVPRLPSLLDFVVSAQNIKASTC